MVHLTTETGPGYQLAIKTLRDAAEVSNTQGPDFNLTQFAVLVSAASFLEGQAGIPISLVSRVDNLTSRDLLSHVPSEMFKEDIDESVDGN